VLIQFGHNDSHEPGRPESTDPQTEFPANLRRYVEEARAIGATPILLTPVVRRIFGQDGRLVGELQPYAEATRRVAADDAGAADRRAVIEPGAGRVTRT
jgi:lysophospholipase L1-like esterase